MPPKPFTWRSTKPGTAIPLPVRAGKADAGDEAVLDLHIAEHEGAVHECGLDA